MAVNWVSALLGDDRTIQNAAELLTENSLRIVLVVDKGNRLLGTITDGDIRRAVMAGTGMSSLATSVMQPRPISMTQGEPRDNALRVMREKDLLCLPVLDTGGVVVGLETVHDLLIKETRSNRVLLMAGGFGKRLYPLTRDVPKPLLPVGEKPILQMILEQLIEDGFVHFSIAVHYRSQQVRAHFGNGSKWGVEIEYIEESQPLGTAGAICLLDRDVMDAPLLVMNGDLLTKLSFGQLMDHHNDHGGIATICVREYDFQVPYGVVHGDGGRMTEIIEKPVQKFFVNAGIYVLEPELLDLGVPGTAFDMPNLLGRVVDQGQEVSIFPIHEYWLDIGRTEEYERAQVEAPR